MTRAGCVRDHHDSYGEGRKGGCLHGDTWTPSKARDGSKAGRNASSDSRDEGVQEGQIRGCWRSHQKGHGHTLRIPTSPSPSLDPLSKLGLRCTPSQQPPYLQGQTLCL